MQVYPTTTDDVLLSAVRSSIRAKSDIVLLPGRLVVHCSSSTTVEMLLTTSCSAFGVFHPNTSRSHVLLPSSLLGSFLATFVLQNLRDVPDQSMIAYEFLREHAYQALHLFLLLPSLLLLRQ